MEIKSWRNIGISGNIIDMRILKLMQVSGKYLTFKTNSDNLIMGYLLCVRPYTQCVNYFSH